MSYHFEGIRIISRYSNSIEPMMQMMKTPLAFSLCHINKNNTCTNKLCKENSDCVFCRLLHYVKLHPTSYALIMCVCLECYLLIWSSWVSRAFTTLMASDGSLPDIVLLRAAVKLSTFNKVRKDLFLYMYN